MNFNFLGLLIQEDDSSPHNPTVDTHTGLEPSTSNSFLNSGGGSATCERDPLSPSSGVPPLAVHHHHPSGASHHHSVTVVGGRNTGKLNKNFKNVKYAFNLIISTIYNIHNLINQWRDEK